MISILIPAIYRTTKVSKIRVWRLWIFKLWEFNHQELSPEADCYRESQRIWLNIKIDGVELVAKVEVVETNSCGHKSQVRNVEENETNDEKSESGWVHPPMNLVMDTSSCTRARQHTISFMFVFLPEPSWRRSKSMLQIL